LTASWVSAHNPSMAKDWRQKLSEAMADRGLTQYRLAKETGLNQSRISLWLSGTGDPTIEQWVTLCRALDVPLSWFYPQIDSAIPEYRTPQEQSLVRVARKVGIDSIWELIASAAVERIPRQSDEGTPPVSTIRPIRELTSHEPPPKPEDDGKGEPKPGRKKK
jgi:transcriptional regulator with XRE-family HTH domain